MKKFLKNYSVLFFLIFTGVHCFSQAPGCPNINIDGDTTTDCDNKCADLTATFLETGLTDSYQVSSITYAPPFPFTGLANPIGIGVDDIWSDVIDLPFDFCFFGDTYNQIQVGSNGVLRLEIEPVDLTNEWQFDEDIPNNVIPALGEANIFGVGHDIDPSILGSNPEIAWELTGTSPCRTFVVSYANLTHFDPSCVAFESTSQIVLYETTNVIEVYVKDKPFCTTWNQGNAVIGIQNNPGDIAYVPPGRNTSDSPWETTNEAWRFTPNGDPNYEINWFDDAGNNIGNTVTINVCPTVDTNYTAEIIYTNCNGDLVTLTDDIDVTGTDSPNAGADGTLDICAGSTTTIDLFTLLGDMPSTGGTWSPTLTSGTGVFDPAIDPPGTYTYTVIGTLCPDPDSADVVVTYITAPDAGTDGVIDICESATSIDLFTILGGTPDTGGSWTPALTSGTGVFDPAVDLGGVYTYSFDSTPGECNTDQATVTVTITPIQNAGEPGTVDICANATTTDLFTIIGGTPDTGGIWSPPLTSGTGVFDPATDTAGVYTYTVTSENNCGTDETTVTVTVTPILNAGEPGTIDICANDTTIDLFTILEGTPDTGGSWDPLLTSGAGVFDPATDTAGVYTYTVTSENDCGTDQATVTVNTVVLPTITLISTNCTDTTYEVIYDVDTESNITTTAGEVDSDGNRIFNIPQGTAIEITANATNLASCSSTLTVMTPDCSCPQITLDNPKTICVDQNGAPVEGFEYPIITTELDATQYTFVWMLEGVPITGEVAPLITAREPGTYDVLYTDITSGCTEEASVTVVFDSGPENLILSLTEGVFSQNNGILANVTGEGPFEFSLDGGAFQESNRFDNVSLGVHEVTVSGGNDCGAITEIIFVLGFPNFFTPNNDGFNDFWNVIGDFEIPAMDIYIFDRYGKLLKQLDPNEKGWDGTYKGVPLPATDYWFTAELKDRSEKYRSHFTLIR
ncbi:T9SS type B sorting domain-containing protein [Aquimarina sp. RZ0]|uniref:T9SS type B sorting domain-containing protein n=1 Tax=Aquimarina sp. RZ0 TaxID=2607730 RepID=UPI0011F2BD26|nr:T9SS type B sorting domain-containing protein [Aquimarina sp. RZ0]KAA1246389.1 T9SS type B sorting domain-containing protein [Aquimarina sp. RZ0]